MSYQVIARKWRPQTFKEVTGQEPITRTLRNAIEHERLHHAYLFSGARGVGKTTTARLLAKALNCHKSERPTPTPCKTTDEDQCPSCREVAEGRSIDVLEIDAASNTGVDNVRDSIINTVGTRPARDRYKVFIIDEVHMLSGAAFNALLKTLEEPPPRVAFIMATTESHKIPDTILSRSQQFEFRTIAAPRIAERLRLIADAEQISVADEALREIARAGEGSMRDAQSAFDQVISFSSGKIGVSEVETALGIAGSEMRARVMRAVAENKPAEALAVVDDLTMRGHDLRNFCRDLLAHLRDLLVLKIAGDGAGAADLTEIERKEMTQEAAQFSESDLVRFFHSLTETAELVRESIHPRYQLEIGLVKLIEMRRLAPLAQILERLGALEEALRTGKLSAPDAGSAPSSSSSTPAGSGGGGAGGMTPRGSRTASAASNFNATTAEEDAVMPRAKNDDAAPNVFDEGDGDVTDAVAASGRHADDAPPFEPLPPRPPAASPAAAASLKSIPKLPASAKPASTASAAGASSSSTSTPHASRQQPMTGDASASATQSSSLPPSVSSFASPSSSPNLTLVPAPAAPTNAHWGFEPDVVPARSFFGEPETVGDDWVGPGVPAEAEGAINFPPNGDGEVTAHDDHAAVTTAHVAPLTRSPVAPDADATGGESLQRIKKALDERRKPLLVIALEGARRVRFDDEELYAEYAPEARHLRDALAKPDSVKILREVCREVSGRDVGVRIVVKEAGESEDGSGGGAAVLTKGDEERLEKQRLREMAEQHPAVKQLLKTFRAEIVDVRRVEPER